jgi:glycosyltransferase involved in cell wall biosynthesis
MLLVPPDICWEIIIVDNGSTDDTAELIEQFSSDLPVRRIYEPLAGLSRARNRGVDVAQGEYIIWTDDDCEPAYDWLAAYVKAFRQFPGSAVFGGTVEPVLETPATEWFQENINLLQWVVAKRNFGTEYRPLSIAEDCLPFGANAAVRAHEQHQNSFDMSLGVQDNSRMVAEEITLFRKILESGALGTWVPDASVKHHIPRNRQTFSYVEQYFFGHGEFGAYIKLSEGLASRSGLLMHHIPRAIANRVLYHVTKIFLPARFWLPKLTNLGSHRGAIAMARSYGKNLRYAGPDNETEPGERNIIGEM